MAFIARRFFSSTPRLWTVKPSLGTPAPVNRIAVLSTPELRALNEKAQGHWNNISNEEKVMCKYLQLLFVCVYETINLTALFSITQCIELHFL